jgi:predicted NBD/HSP70 family sugar kinase
MRAYNERLVLSLVRRHGSLAKTDIARMTGLSAQTVSVIMRGLEKDRLLVRGEPLRGRVGQPSVPLSLNPAGAYFFGFKIGRRSAEMALVDFLGHVQATTSRGYAYPLPSETIAFAKDSIAELSASLGRKKSRIAGLGIAIPFQMWNWAEEAGAPAADLDTWRTVDVRAEIAAFCRWPVYLQNDATAACGAELVFGRHSGLQDFVYFFVGTFVGGGIVLNGNLYAGRTGNAGALGSTPVPGPDGATVQLLDRASLVVLERTLRAAGIDPTPLWTADGDWSAFGDHVEVWLDNAAAGLAHAIVASASVIDFEAAVIDGILPPDIRTRLVARVGDAMQHLDLEGIEAPKLLEGTIGPTARALGGAAMPLFDRYLIDQHALMRAD